MLSLGIGSLLRTVTLSGAMASNPSTVSATDALGARPAPLVTGNTQLIGVIKDGLGIFNGTSGLYRGFGSYQPFVSVQPPASIASEAGASSTAPAIIGYRLGRGIVVDIGLPGLGSMLAAQRGRPAAGVSVAPRPLSMSAYLGATPAFARCLPGRRHRLEVHRGPTAAGVHAVYPSCRLRRGGVARQRRHLHQHRRALRDDRSVPRYYFEAEDQARRDALVRRAAGFLLLATSAVAIALAAASSSALAADPQPHRRDDFPRSGARAVGFHEPRAGLCAAARRRTPAGLRDGVAGERRGHDRLLGRAGRRFARRRARSAAWQLRQLNARAPGALVDDAPAPGAATGGSRALGSAASLRPPDGAGRSLGLRAQHRRSLLHLPPAKPGPRRALLDRNQARGRGRLHRASVPVRLASARLFGLERRGGRQAVRVGDDLLRAG